MDAERIQPLFAINYRVIKRQTDGLTHADSLLQPPFRGNCLNWVLGHILASRRAVHRILGQPPLWDDARAARYMADSEPITDPTDPAIVDLATMLADLERSQALLDEGFAELSDAQLAEVNDRGRTVADRLLFFAWHEGYHVGQTEYLRQLAGKDDKVI